MPSCSSVLFAGTEAETVPEVPAVAEAEVSKAGGNAKPAAEKSAEELEEENYKQMQNFEEYSKAKGKNSKLTLADLMGGGGAAALEAEDAQVEEGEVEGGEEEYAEEYYDDGEYYEGEEGEYYEEEAATPPEVGPPYMCRAPLQNCLAVTCHSETCFFVSSLPVPDVAQLDGVAALRPRKERAMENLNDWWSGALGEEIENERRMHKRTADSFDPLVFEDKTKLVTDLRTGGRGASAGARRVTGDDTRGLMRRPDMSGIEDDDGRTKKLVSKLFAEQRAGNTGKQTAGSQAMFQVFASC